MSFLRRWRGGGSDGVSEPPDPDADDDAPAVPDEAESARELAMVRDEQARLDDLAQRQLRYARYAWQPPAQGSDRRADDSADEAH